MFATNNQNRCIVFFCPAADVDLHFWDATDELLGCQMDLLFERDRVYFHKAHGHFGAVPLNVSGIVETKFEAVEIVPSLFETKFETLRPVETLRPLSHPHNDTISRRVEGGGVTPVRRACWAVQVNVSGVEERWPLPFDVWRAEANI